MPSTEYVEGGRLPGRTARRLQRFVLERRYGMPPGALRDVDLVDIGFGAPGRVREHIPSPWGVLGRILRRGDVGREDVFIDIGCGMGPVLVEAAARYDFRRVIGIDIVPEFTQVARETIARGHGRLRCRDVEVTTADVIDYELPDDVTVVYMADPFRGHIFDVVLGKLIASVDRHPRRLRIIYFLPVEGGRLERTGRVRLVRYGRRRNRPWSRTLDLAMYELEPSSDGARPGAERPPTPPGGLGRRLRSNRSVDGGDSSGADAGPEQGGEAPIQITSTDRGGSRIVQGSARRLRSLRAAFERHHCVRLPRFLDAPILERVQRYVDEGEFDVREHEGIRNELRMDAGKATELLLLLINDPHLFGLVRAVTGCTRIGRFDGTIYRVMPGDEGEDSWHGEIFGHGIVEMSIDLSTRPYSGGVLESRDRYSRHVLHTEVGTEPGDALLVRLAPSVQHRVTAVQGDSPRTVYAGRFSLFKRGSDSKLARPGGGPSRTSSRS